MKTLLTKEETENKIKVLDAQCSQLMQMYKLEFVTLQDAIKRNDLKEVLQLKKEIIKIAEKMAEFGKQIEEYRKILNEN